MMRMRLTLVLLGLGLPAVAAAQTTQPAGQVTLPTVTVTAQKEPADPQGLPVSVSIVPLDSLWNGGMKNRTLSSGANVNSFAFAIGARRRSNAWFASA